MSLALMQKPYLLQVEFYTRQYLLNSVGLVGGCKKMYVVGISARANIQYLLAKMTIRAIPF